MSGVVLKLKTFECFDKFQHFLRGVGEGAWWFCIFEANSEALFEEREKQMNVDRFTDIISYFNFRLGNGYIRIYPYPTAFPYGNGMVLHFYQQQESSTTKTVHKVINRGLKAYV